MAHLVGTPGADTITGTPESDVIEGLAGDDILVGVGGNDRLFDGPGSDRCYLGSGGGSITADLTDAHGRDWFFGDLAAARTTAVHYQSATQPLIVNLQTGVVRGAETGWDRLVDIKFVAGGSADDLFIGDDSTLSGFVGGAGNDVAHGYGGIDWLTGHAGNDRLYGGGGDDILNGDEGSNLIRGGDGDDIINFNSYYDEEPQRVFGDAGDDYVAGGFGSDRISGGAGDDYIIGYEGQDILVGGTGADRFETSFIVESLDMTGKCDVIVDFEDGIDKLRVFGSARAQDFLDGARAIPTGIAIDFGFGAFLQMRNFTLAQFDASDFVVT